MQNEKEVIQNYHNYISGKLQELQAILQKPELNPQAADALKAVCAGFENELKYVSFRLDTAKAKEVKG